MGDTIDLLYKIQADTSDAKKKTDEQIKLLEKMKSVLTDPSAQKAAEKDIENYKALSKSLGEAAGEAEKLKTEAGKIGKEGFDTLNTQALIDNFEKLSQTCLSITKQIADLGSSTIDSAKKLGGMENAIIRLSSSAEEGQELVTFLKDLSTTSQEFSVESLLQTGKNMAKFDDSIKGLGLDIKELIPVIMDFADVQDKDVAEASEILAKALSGVRGGMNQAAVQFGITKEKLEELGAKMKESGEVDANATETKLALVEAIKEMATRAGKGTEAFENAENATAKWENSITLLKASIGEELLPYVTKVTGYLAEMAVNLTKLDSNTKLALAGIGGLAIGVTAAAGALAGIASVLMRALTIAGEFGTLLASLPAIPILPWLAGISAFLVSGPAAIGACVIAVKLVVDWTNQWKIATANLKLKDTKKELDDYAIALQNVAKVMPGVVTAQQAYNEIKKEGIENLEKDIQGQEKAKAALKAIAQEELNLMSQRSEEYKKLADLKQKLADAKEDGADKGLIEDLTGQVAEQEKLVNRKTESINKVKEEKIELQDILGILQGINAESKNGKGLIDDKDLTELINHQKDLVEAQRQSRQQMVDTLENYKAQYKLTEDQILEIDKTVIQERAKIKTEEEKLIKDQETKEKEAVAEKKKAWTDYLGNLNDILKLGRISQEQYNEYIRQYYKENETDLQADSDLKKEIINSYWTGVKVLDDAAATEKNKKREEELKAEEEKREEELKAEEEKKKQLIDQGKQLVEEERKRQEEILQTRQEINSKIFELNKNINSTEALQAQYEAQKLIFDTISSQGDALLTRYQAGQEMTAEELKGLEVYLNQRKTLEDIGGQIESNTEKEIAANEERRKSLQESLNYAVAMGTKTQQEANAILNQFIQKGLQDSVAAAEELIKKPIETWGSEGNKIIASVEKWAEEAEKAGVEVGKYLPPELQKLVDKTDTLITNTKKVSEETGNISTQYDNATTAAEGFNQTVKKTSTSIAESAEEAKNLVETIGNITSSSSGGSTGNFMSIEDMAASMPGTGTASTPTQDQALNNIYNSTSPNSQIYYNWLGSGSTQSFENWASEQQGYDNYSNDLVAQKVGNGIAGSILSKSAGDLVANVNTGMVQVVNSALSAINPNLVAANQAISSVNTALINPSQAISATNPSLLSVNQAVTSQATDYSETQTAPAGVATSSTTTSEDTSSTSSSTSSGTTSVSSGPIGVITKKITLADMQKLIEDVKAGKVLAPPTITGGRLSVEELEKQYNAMLESANQTNTALTAQETILEDIGEQIKLNATEQIKAFETAKSENEEFYSIMVSLGKMSSEQAAGAMKDEIQKELTILYSQTQSILQKTREQMTDDDRAVLKEYIALKEELESLNTSSSSSSTSKVFSSSDLGLTTSSSSSSSSSSTSTSNNYKTWSYNTDASVAKKLDVSISILVNGKKVNASSSLVEVTNALASVLSNDRSIDL